MPGIPRLDRRGRGHPGGECVPGYLSRGSPISSGGRSGAYEEELGKARTIALNELEDRAAEKGANAVVGVDLDYEVINNMLMVSASGTAVTVEHGAGLAMDAWMPRGWFAFGAIFARFRPFGAALRVPRSPDPRFGPFALQNLPHGQ